MTHKRPSIAVFASGGGTTFRAVAEAIHSGVVDFDITLIVTDRENAGVLQQVAEVNRAHKLNIKTIIINKKRFPDGPQGRGQTRGEASALLDALEKHNIDHLALMGCLRIIAPQVIDAWGWKPEYAQTDPIHKGIYQARMSNTHPGILPATADTFGIHAQEKALRLGLDETAQTFHVVAAGVDAGPVIAERRVPVFAPSRFARDVADNPEKLFARVQRIEKACLPCDLDAFLKNQMRYRQAANSFAL